MNEKNLGNKCSNLNWLKQKSFKVPYFVTIDQSEILNREIILQKISNLHFPLAARSSFTGEDGGQYSFAGIFESVLHNKNQEELMNAIQKVSSSLESSRLNEYCQFHNIEKPKWGSIVIQEMVEAAISGVTFTQSPLDPEGVLISSAPGFGDQLVSGQVEAEEVSLDRKKPKFLATQNLSAVHLKKLFEICLSIERQKGKPQDIEWALDKKGEIFILQTRDITTLKKLSEDITVLDNSNIQESFTGLTLPLTFSYAKNAYQESYDTLMRVMGFSEKEIRNHQWRHQHMLGLIDGRVYYNINSWYQGLLFLPGFKKNKKDMEEMMGLDKPIDFVQSKEGSFFDRLKSFPSILRLIFKLGIQFSFIKKLVFNFDLQMIQLFDQHWKKQIDKLSLTELLHYLRRTKELGFSLWGTPLVNDFYVMMKSGAVRRVLERYNSGHLYPQLILTHNLESFKPILFLQDLAESVQNNKDLSTLFLSNDSSFIISELKNNHQLFWEKTLNFINQYGDRVPGELKLETKTFRTDVLLLIQTLKLFIHSHSSSTETEQGRDLILSQALEKMSLLDRISFRKKLKQLQNGLQYRELMRLHRTRSFGVIRDIYLHIARKFIQFGVLKTTEDIFYLTESEIEDYITYQSIQNNLQGIVDLRKEEYSKYTVHQKYQNQLHLIHGETISKYETNSQLSLTEFKGFGCYPGSVTAEICYVQNLDTMPDLTNKILLAERTDPGWTPLFYLANGIIVEKGSLLSHAAIVAREVGRPLIIGVSKITKYLKSGDLVTMNGNSGVVQLSRRNSV